MIERPRTLRVLVLGCVALPLLYFGSLGPAQVLHNRAWSGLDPGSSSDIALMCRNNIALDVYSRPAFAVMSNFPLARRVGAQYVRWWLDVTHTSPRMRASEEFWYDFDS